MTNQQSLRSLFKNPLFPIAVALILGVVMGAMTKQFPDSFLPILLSDYVKPFSDALLGFLTAVAAVMIFFSLIDGIAGVGTLSAFGKIGGRLIGRFYLVLLILSGAVTLTCVWFFSPTLTGGSAGGLSGVWQLLLSVLPHDLLSPVIEGNTLQLIFLAAFLGAVILLIGDDAAPVKAVIHSLCVLFQKALALIVRLMPLIVFACVWSLISAEATEDVRDVWIYPVLFVSVSVLYMVFCVFRAAFVSKTSPKELFRALLPSLAISFTTASSLAAYPQAVTACRDELGIDRRLVDIGIPLGQVLFKPSGSINFILFPLVSAHLFHVPITPVWILTLWLVGTLAAIAMPPVPGGALICYTLLCAELGLPPQAATIAFALEVFYDPIGTTTNVLSMQTEVLVFSARQSFHTENLPPQEEKE